VAVVTKRIPILDGGDKIPAALLPIGTTVGTVAAGDAVTAVQAAAAAALAAHDADTLGVHGIADTTALVTTARTITAGAGLTGGGSLAANRTLAVAYGTTAGTATQGNDPRLSGNGINVRSYGALGDGTTLDDAAFTAAIAALGTGDTLHIPAGTYVVSGIVIQGKSDFAVRGERGARLTIAANSVADPNRASRNILTLVDCQDFVVDGLTVDGRRDEISPLTPLAANATTGQPSVQVANGLGARYLVGQRLNVCGGLTVTGGAESDRQNQQMQIASITPGTAGANDTITFTTNLTNTYTSAAGTIDDPYGPYAANGAYITPWQTGAHTIAGLALTEEDQQNGIHLIRCHRFRISGCDIRNMWECSIRLGHHLLDGSAQQDGCTFGTITGNTIHHGYDQGVAVWLSHDITVTGNTISSAGWAGISCTLSDDCTITGNVSSDNVQRIPNDTKSGHGVAIEGGRRNTVSGNLLRNNYGCGVYLTAGGTFPFGGAAQQFTTVTAGSNETVLPQATINVASTAAFANAGQFTVMGSGGPQQITYTGKTGTSFTGCTGGRGGGTLYTGARITQYPVFIQQGGALPIASTSITVSDGTKFQPGGRYAIVDGPRTERITVATVAANTITLTEPTAYRHPDQCQIGQSVATENVIVGNSIAGTVADAGIRLSSAVRTLVYANIIDRAALRGVDLTIWAAGGMQAPYGTVLAGNIITAPDVTGDGAAYQAISATWCSDLTITDNRCGGSPSTQGYYIALHLQAVTDSTITGNQITDTYAIGARLDAYEEFGCRRLQFTGNQILRVLGEGLIVWGGDSLTITGNILSGCAANNGPGGYGGALNLRGVQNSQISGNTIVNNGHGGIGLDNATLHGVDVPCAGNLLAGNIVRDDGRNTDVFNGAATQQGSGIKELAAGQGPNTYVNNLVSGNGTNWDITSLGNTLRGNLNYNPVGRFASQPAVPASTVPQVNNRNADATVHVTGGTVTGIAIGGQTTGLTTGSIRVPAGQSITLTYSSAPTWTWFGD
jgi:parallel beta-helix repeat protein